MVNACHTRQQTWTEDMVCGTMKTSVRKDSHFIFWHAVTANRLVPNALLLFLSKKSVNCIEEMKSDLYKNSGLFIS